MKDDKEYGYATLNICDLDNLALRKELNPKFSERMVDNALKRSYLILKKDVKGSEGLIFKHNGFDIVVEMKRVEKKKEEKQ